MPLYGLASHMAQLIVVAYGIYLIEAGQVTIGLLIGFLFYVNNLYGPMRQLATVWSSFQLAMAGLDRISEVLALESNMPVVDARAADPIRSSFVRCGSSIPMEKMFCATSASRWDRERPTPWWPYGRR